MHEMHWNPFLVLILSLKESKAHQKWKYWNYIGVFFTYRTRLSQPVHPFCPLAEYFTEGKADTAEKRSTCLGVWIFYERKLQVTGCSSRIFSQTPAAGVSPKANKDTCSRVVLRARPRCLNRTVYYNRQCKFQSLEPIQDHQDQQIGDV